MTDRPATSPYFPYLISRLMSIALTEWVSAPTDMMSTPVSATALEASRLMPPDASRRQSSPHTAYGTEKGITFP